MFFVSIRRLNEKIIKILDLGGGIGINYKNEKIIHFNEIESGFSISAKK